MAPKILATVTENSKGTWRTALVAKVGGVILSGKRIHETKESAKEELFAYTKVLAADITVVPYVKPEKESKDK